MRSVYQIKLEGLVRLLDWLQRRRRYPDLREILRQGTCEPASPLEFCRTRHGQFVEDIPAPDCSKESRSSLHTVDPTVEAGLQEQVLFQGIVLYRQKKSLDLPGK